MNQLFPYPLQAGFDDSGLRHNPSGTIPFPNPQSNPVGAWDSTEMQLTWVNGPGPISGAKVFRWAAWQSPVFDLRPEIRSAASSSAINASPIWRGGAGAGGQLFVRLSGLTSTPSAGTGLKVSSTELAHPFDPLQVGIVMGAADVSLSFIDMTNTVLVAFLPPGSGYPVRYWRLRLAFEFLSNHADPQFFVSCAYY